jgi:dihydroxyacetone kinase-like predicted kinase
MAMIRDEIDGALLKKMILAGAESVEREKEGIDSLNVFPVPDRDTGANMFMMLASAVREISAIDRIDMRSVACALLSGSEKGAHGNSGVIPFADFQRHGAGTGRFGNSHRFLLCPVA